MKVVLCGGHLTPALALIEELKKRKEVEVVFFGRKYATEGAKNPSVEYRLVGKKGPKFREITAGRFQRRFTKYTIPALLKLPVGFIQSFIYLLFERPHLVVSFGGYLSTPIVFSAWLIGIPSITHEQASIPGLATKINSLFVDKIFLSFPKSAQYFEKEKTEVIGNLVQDSVFKGESKNAKLKQFLAKSKNLIFVTGGNQGSHFLNKLTFSLFPKLSDYSFLHQVGSTNWEGDLDKAGKIAKKNYFAVEYLEASDFGLALEKADLVIARSGANTVWDLALFKKPSVLVPLPKSSGGEQAENAKLLKDAGFAKVVNQKEADVQKMEKSIREIFKNLKGYKKAGEKFAASLPKDSVQKLIKAILAYK